MITVVYSAITTATYFFVNLMILCFLIGFTLYFDAFYKHFSFLVKKFDNPANESEDMDYPPAVHAKNTLRKIIKFHNVVKE